MTFVPHYGRTLLLLCLTVGLSYQPRENLSRRAALEAFGSAILVIPQGAHAVIGSKGCYQGEGEACAELAENDFIKDLQLRSFDNRAKNEKEARDAFYMKNYPDWFATVGKVMIKRQDGSFVVVSDIEAAEMRKEGKLEYEIPRTSGGRLIDYTQKPILTLKE